MALLKKKGTHTFLAMTGSRATACVMPGAPAFHTGVREVEAHSPCGHVWQLTERPL